MLLACPPSPLLNVGGARPAFHSLGTGGSLPPLGTAKRQRGKPAIPSPIKSPTKSPIKSKPCWEFWIKGR
jgi:hypothetical protein